MVQTHKKKQYPFKGLPKERAVFEAARSFANRVKHLVGENFFTDMVFKGFKDGEIGLSMGSDGLAFVAEPKPKKPSYDDLTAQIAELKAKLGE